MQLYKALDQVQAYSCAAIGRLPGMLGLIEAVEDVPFVLVVDTDAGVADLDFQLFF